MSRIKVYIASPYTIGRAAVNIKRQIDCADQLIRLGYAPYAPIPTTHFQDIAHPQEYEMWIELDFVWVLACDVVLRLKGESPGADREVEFARNHSIPVVYSVEELVQAVPSLRGPSWQT